MFVSSAKGRIETHQINLADHLCGLKIEGVQGLTPEIRHKICL